jgi:hypothetical protein
MTSWKTNGVGRVNIKMVLMEVDSEDGRWMKLAHDCVHLRY